MFDYKKAEIAAGAFLLLGLAVLAYLSISVGGLKLLPRDSYRLRARFSNVGDLKLRAPVKVAGVTIGKRGGDPAGRLLRAKSSWRSIARSSSRRTPSPRSPPPGCWARRTSRSRPAAPIGNLAAGERITHTEPALNVADLLGRYAFGNANQSPPAGHGRERPARSERRPATPKEQQ